MHELSVALSLLELAQEEADRRGAPRVEALHLKMGLLSGVDAAALRGAFELARENSDFAEARLEITEIPVTAHCSTCQQIRPAASLQELCCQTCGTPLHDIVTGRELELTALEIAS